MSRTAGRWKLLLIVALFFAPVIAAVTLMFFRPDWIPQDRVNYGTLVSPARPAPALALADLEGEAAPTALTGKWSLVYLAGPTCDEACRAQLVTLRQVRLALNQNRNRVQRVYLAPDAAALAAAHAALAAEHPDLRFFVDGEARAARFFGAADAAPAPAHAVYLLDPLGNWLMSYGGAVEPKGLYKDLKKLLRYSQIG